MSTWVKLGYDDIYERQIIWFATGIKKPDDKWDYLCDGKLSAQEMDRFMVMHRTICDLG